jgi:ATP-binding cassette subfamily B protein
MKKKFPEYRQLETSDCGPTCLRIIAKHYDKVIPIDLLRKRSYINRDGVSVANLAYAAESVGFRSLAISADMSVLESRVPLPCIAMWRKKHYVVVYKIKDNKVFVSDPAHGLIDYSRVQFFDNWRNPGSENKGVLLLLEPTPTFYTNVYDKERKNHGIRLLFKHILLYQKYLVQVLLGVLLGSILLFIFPFLTQIIVDHGIKDQNIEFVYLILFAQLTLFFSRSLIDMVRGWLLLHIGTRVNVAIISDFLIKLMKLPISVFDSKSIGDLMQRIDDNRRLERFLSSSSLSAIFSFFSIIIFSFILAYYNIKIFLVFLVGTSVYIAWISMFLKKIALWEYRRIDQNSDERGKIIALIRGIKDIKINSSENKRRWEWEEIQARIFNISTKRLALTQYQTNGALFI